MTEKLTANESEAKKANPLLAMYVLFIFALFGGFVLIVLAMVGVIG